MCSREKLYRIPQIDSKFDWRRYAQSQSDKAKVKCAGDLGLPTALNHLILNHHKIADNCPVVTENLQVLDGAVNKDMCAPCLVNFLAVLYDDAGDLQKAVVYYKKAAESKDKQAEFNLAELYAIGVGVEKDLQKAAEYFAGVVDCRQRRDASGEMSAAGEDAVLGATMKLFEMYKGTDNAEGKLQMRRAIDYLKSAAEAGFTEAQLLLGKIFTYKWFGFPHIYERDGRMWLSKAKSESKEAREILNGRNVMMLDEDKIRNKHFNFMYRMYPVFPEETRVEKMTQLMESCLESSPTAKLYLDAYNECRVGFDLLKESDCKDPAALEHMVNGALIQELIYRDWWLEHSESSPHLIATVEFIRDQCFDENNPDAVFLVHTGLLDTAGNTMLNQLQQFAAGIAKIASCDMEDKVRQRKMLGFMTYHIGCRTCWPEQVLHTNQWTYLAGIKYMNEALDCGYDEVRVLVDIATACANLGLIQKEPNIQYFQMALDKLNLILEKIHPCHLLYIRVLSDKAYMIYSIDKQNPEWKTVTQQAIDAIRNRLPFLHIENDAVIDHLKQYYKSGVLHVPKCLHCRRSAEFTESFKSCPCHTAVYCSKSCQKANWSKHKQKCKVNKAKNTTLAIKNTK